MSDRPDGLKFEELSEESQLVLRNVQGGLWKTRTVDEQPDLELVKWNVFAVPSPKGDRVSHHFNGYCPANYEGRVSSEIVEFDMETKVGKTRSGRTYQLQGQPGFDGDAHYVFRNWISMYGVGDDDIEDATGDYLTLEEKQDIKPGYTE